MDSNTEIVTLLREIRDVQKERLALQKKLMKDTEGVQQEALKGQRETLALQKKGSALQKIALIACAIFTIFAVIFAFR
jgi:hypothetical protein